MSAKVQRWLTAARRIEKKRAACNEEEKKLQARLKSTLREAAAWLEDFLNSDEGRAALKVLKAAESKVSFASSEDWKIVLTGDGCLKTYKFKDTEKISTLEFVEAFYRHHEHDIGHRVINDLKGTLKKVVVGLIDSTAREGFSKESIGT